jgi:hypothetical protein
MSRRRTSSFVLPPFGTCSISALFHLTPCKRSHTLFLSLSLFLSLFFIHHLAFFTHSSPALVPFRQTCLSSVLVRFCIYAICSLFAFLLFVSHIHFSYAVSLFVSAALTTRFCPSLTLIYTLSLRPDLDSLVSCHSLLHTTRYIFAARKRISLSFLALFIFLIISHFDSTKSAFFSLSSASSSSLIACLLQSRFALFSNTFKLFFSFCEGAFRPFHFYFRLLFVICTHCEMRLLCRQIATARSALLLRFLLHLFVILSLLAVQFLL